MKNYFFVCLILQSMMLNAGLIGSTLVQTPNGLKPLEVIELGQKVFTSNEDGKKTISFVVAKKREHASRVVTIKFEGGSNLTCDRIQHMFDPVSQSWKEAQSFASGDYVLGSSLARLKVVEVELVEGDHDLYDISIPKYHSYCVGPDSALVHNFVIMLPVASWVIGEGFVWLGGAAAAAAGTVMLKAFLKKLTRGTSSGSYSDMAEVAKPKQSTTSKSGQASAGGSPPPNDNDPNNRNNKSTPRNVKKEKRERVEKKDYTEKELRAIAKGLGFEKTNYFTRRGGRAIYKKGNLYISGDEDSHKGGVWKVAKSRKALESNKVRMGTYNIDLSIKIGQ